MNGRTTLMIIAAMALVGAATVARFAPAEAATSTSVVAKPSFTPASKTFTDATLAVEMGCDTYAAKIYYTTDGTTIPSESSKLYTAPLKLTASTTVMARAYKSGMSVSLTTTGTYIKKQAAVATPVLSPAACTFSGSQKVTISCTTSGAKIRYTTDGSEPNSSSSAYGSALTFTSTTTLKAKAFKSGMTDSGAASAKYTKAEARVSTVRLVDADNSKRYSESNLYVVIPAGGKRKVTVTAAKSSADSGAAWGSAQPAWASPFSSYSAKETWNWSGSSTSNLVCTAGGVSKIATITAVSQSKVTIKIPADKVAKLIDLLKSVITAAGGESATPSYKIGGTVVVQNVDKYASPSIGTRLEVRDLGFEGKLSHDVPIPGLSLNVYVVKIGGFLRPTLVLNAGGTCYFDESYANPWGGSLGATLTGSLAVVAKAYSGLDSVFSSSVSGYAEISVNGNFRAGYENSVPGLYGYINLGETVLGLSAVVKSKNHEIYNRTIKWTVLHGKTVPSTGSALLFDLRSLKP